TRQDIGRLTATGRRLEPPWRQAVPVNDVEQILSQCRHIGMNLLRKKGTSPSSARAAPAHATGPMSHATAVGDCLETLRRIPTGSIQLVVCDPPDNVNVAAWDEWDEWAAKWIREVERVLAR